MNSLRARLLLISTVVLAAFLMAGGLALERAFRESAMAAQRDKLTGLIYGLLGAAEEGSNGNLLIFPADLPDPRLREPESGLEAAILAPDGALVWASAGFSEALPKPAPVPVGQWDFTPLPAAGRLRLAFGLRWLGLDAESHEYTAVVYENTDGVDALRNQFRRELWTWFLAVALGLTAAMLAALTLLMRPVQGLTRKLQRIEQGESDAIEGRYPLELEPLVDAMNAMIRRERTQLTRYRHALGDLAHSLKTPLSVIRGTLDSEDAPDARRRVVNEQVQRMQSIIDHQLGRAARAGKPTLTRPLRLRPLAERVVQAMRKVHHERGLDIRVLPGADPKLRADRGDLFEMLGNLLENATRLANREVLVEVRLQEQQVVLRVDDDGPGFPADAERLLQRGQRADSRHAGQGIGLSVVKELVDAYEGQLRLGQSPRLGGARVEVELPLR